VRIAEEYRLREFDSQIACIRCGITGLRMAPTYRASQSGTDIYFSLYIAFSSLISSRLGQHFLVLLSPRPQVGWPRSARWPSCRC
jgi:hypothetical protein